MLSNVWSRIILGVVPAQAGTHNPWPFDFGMQVATLRMTRATVVMGPRLRGDDSW